MIRDKLNKEEKDDLQAEALRPRIGFLIASAITGAAAVVAYFALAAQSGDFLYVLLIGCLIFLAMFLLLCYRQPQLGNRFLGYDIVSTPRREKEKSSLNYAGSFEVESGATEKRMASKRKQARHSRRKLAEVTRQMKAEKAPDTEAGKKTDD
ncbi:MULTISPECIES: hypothetical protein [Kordiimonas]|jgi:hypothetical protein|uniref:hypothetical protein n=1 Tax=Kordiimonas TaxID=288021 RepID=UPI002579E696|nr:hypothetical protein [Kordiimonas sp. UBA4487]